MRIDCKNPRQRYDYFWNWLRTDRNAMWIIFGLFSFMYYLITTYEARTLSQNYRGLPCQKVSATI